MAHTERNAGELDLAGPRKAPKQPNKPAGGVGGVRLLSASVGRAQGIQGHNWLARSHIGIPAVIVRLYTHSHSASESLSSSLPQAARTGATTSSYLIQSTNPTP